MAIVFTSMPRRGDAVIGKTQTGEVLYVKQESLTQQSDIDTSVYEIIGVVLKRRGNDVLIAYKNNENKQWAQRYVFLLSGYTLDGTDRTGTLCVRTAADWNTAVDKVVSYNATTLAQMVEQLNTYFQANEPFITQDWVAEVNGEAIVLHFNFVAAQQASNTAKDGFALTANLLPEIPANANMLRRNGAGGGDGAISAWYKALAYFRADLNNGTYNPKSAVTSVKRGYPICLPGYLGTSQYSDGDQCAFLRSVYGEGEAGWLKFMQSCLPVLNTDFGDMGVKDGLARTRLMAQKRFTSPAKTDAPVFPAADYCQNVGTVCIPQGSWFLGTGRDINDMLSDIRYNSDGNDRTLDAVNATLYKLGGTAISNSTYWWSCLRLNANYAWYSNGSYGYWRNNYMYYSLGCVPLSLQKLA